MHVYVNTGRLPLNCLICMMRCVNASMQLISFSNAELQNLRQCNLI